MASWIMKRGFLGWRMAHISRNTSRTIKKMTRRKAHGPRRRRFAPLPLWSLHSFVDMVG